jgi:hypothetical protein
MPPKPPRNSKGKEVLKSPGPTTPNVPRNVRNSPSLPSTAGRTDTAPAGINPFDQDLSQAIHTALVPHSTPQSTRTQDAGRSTEEPWQQVPTNVRKTRSSIASSNTQVATRLNAQSPAPDEERAYEDQPYTPETISYVANAEVPSPIHTQPRTVQRQTRSSSDYGGSPREYRQAIQSPWALPFRTPLISEEEVVSIFSTPKGTYRCSITWASNSDSAVHFDTVETDYLDPDLESVATKASDDLDAAEEFQPLAPDSLTLDGRQEPTVEPPRIYVQHFDEPGEAARIASIPVPNRSDDQERASVTSWKPRSYQKSTYVWREDKEPPTDNRKKPPPSS